MSGERKDPALVKMVRICSTSSRSFSSHAADGKVHSVGEWGEKAGRGCLRDDWGGRCFLTEAETGRMV